MVTLPLWRAGTSDPSAVLSRPFGRHLPHVLARASGVGEPAMVRYEGGQQ